MKAEVTPSGLVREYSGDYTQLLYLRARHYAPGTSRFLTRDTWMGDYNRPLSLNRWMYAEGNPINNTDPTGNAICYRPMGKSLPTACQNGLAYAYAFAKVIKTYVTSGTILPVEGFAMLFDFSKPHFESTRDIMWAVTIVLDDMDANRGAIWQQATGWKGPAESAFYIGLNWLPYLNNPAHNKKPWCDPTNANNCTSEDWPHSLRGDWNQKYWDKTANQAYHFWFYASVAYFDSLSMANIGDYIHDNPSTLVEYDFNGSPEDEAPPPPTVATRPDKELTQKGISLGWSLRDNDFFEEIPCALNPGFLYTDIGSWIRANLKG